MEQFFEWLRKRFVSPELMHLADIESETLKTMVIQNGSSRDAFIKFIVYKLLLGIDSNSDDSKEHNLENIFVSFGLLDKAVAQQFLKGDMSTDLHITTWKRVINAIIPTTIIARPELPCYENLMENIFKNYNRFKLVESKNFLPPELMSKSKEKSGLHPNSDSIDKFAEKLINIIKKPNKNDDGQIITNSAEELPSNLINLELMDLTSIKKEIDQYETISNENKINLSNNQQSSVVITQKMAKLAYEQSLVQSEYFELKVKDIRKLVKAEHDLQILVSALAE